VQGLAMRGDLFKDMLCKDMEGHWWFKTIGKDKKSRQIAVDDAMLNILRYYSKRDLKRFLAQASESSE